MAMHTAARPISECIAATSSGILVISTRFAATAPIAPPTTTPSSTSPKPMPPVCICSFSLNIRAMVVRTAMPMPVMPNALPMRAVDGEDKPFKAWMKHTDATRYSSVTTFMLIMFMRPPWHGRRRRHPWRLAPASLSVPSS